MYIGCLYENQLSLGGMRFLAEALVYIQSHVDLRTEFSIASLGAYLSSARLRKSYFGAYEQVGGSVLPRLISYVAEDMIKSYKKTSTGL